MLVFLSKKANSSMNLSTCITRQNYRITKIRQNTGNENITKMVRDTKQAKEKQHTAVQKNSLRQKNSRREEARN